MTALDTAIIKAYLRQGGLAASDEVEPNETATPEAILNEADRAVPADRRRPSERSPAGAAPPLAVPLEALDLAEAFLTPNVDAPIDRADARTIAPGTTTKENEAASFATVGSPSSDVSPDSQDRPFEPMLRMDTVSWPRPSRRLRHVADRQIERLADTVQKAATTGRNLVGVTSCSHGEGCTTVLLAVALRLVELGSKTLLIDGDIGKPRLADQLALDSEAGWRDVASGHLPLEEVVTQYESESLAFLPYCGRATSFDSTPPPEDTPVAFLHLLRSQYDLILVDLGGSLTGSERDSALAEKLAKQLDSVLTVQNVRATTSSDLATLHQRLHQLGVEEAGIIENFVEDGAS